MSSRLTLARLTLALLALALLAPQAARADCEVSGVASIERLRVRVPGEPLRTLSVTDAPVAVRPGQGGHYRDVRVLAPLAFTARTDAPIPWTVPRPSALADGMLWVTPRAEIEDVRERGSGELVVRVQVDTGVWISRVRVPCAALSVGPGEAGADPPDWGVRGGPRWQLRGDDIWLMSEAGSGATLRVDAPEGLATPLVELEQDDGWVRVAARFASGAVLRGWVRQHHLEAVAASDASPAFHRELPPAPVPRCSAPASSRREYVGPAQVRAGAQVRVDPSGPAWASVAEPSVLTIRWRTGSPWVRLVHVPGLRGDGACPEVLTQAWVPREAVRLQGEP